MTNTALRAENSNSRTITYIVRETTTPHNYTPVDDFTVRITENNPNQPQTWRVLLDDEFEAKLKIIKQDDETKKAVLQKNTEFKIFNMDTEKYVEQVTTYPTTVKHKSYFTDEQGYLILPQNLKIGHYRIEEVNAPYGYTLNENYYEVTVDSNTAYQMDGTSGDVIIEAVYENHPVKGELTIVKKGEVLDGFKDDFTYQTENLEGAEFEIYAAEDIYTADFQKDDNGNRILEYAAGILVKTVTTDKDGKAVLKNLPLGSYKIVEKTAPDGFALNSEAQIITFSYKDQETPVIEQTAIFENDRQKVEISVVKQDADTEAVVAGAEFGLYAKAACKGIDLQDNDHFAMTVGGKLYTDKKEAGVALLSAASGLKSVKSAGQIGEYHGFALSSEYNFLSNTYTMTIKGKCSYKIEFGKDTLGNIQRIHNALSAIGKKLADTEQNLETVQQQLKTAQEEVQKPFPKEAELSEKMERLAELNAMLNMDEKGGENLLADEGIGENPEVNMPEERQDRIADSVHKTSVLERLKEQKQQEQTRETQQKPKKKHEQEL